MKVSCIFGKNNYFKLKMDTEACFSEVGEIEAQVNEVVLELKAKKEGGGGGDMGIVKWVPDS
jgi:hypothetical protein